MSIESAIKAIHAAGLSDTDGETTISNYQLRRIVELALSEQWEPIESAPKDGTAIMLTNGKDVAEGHWYFEEGGTTEYRDLDGRYIDQKDNDGYNDWLDWDGGMQPAPTHWMPLPKPPETKS